MKHTFLKTVNTIFIFLLAIILLGGCTKMSETIRDKSVGMNGSFEHIKSGLPVNWLFYTPQTIPSGDYELILDTTESKEGKQSLKFLVRECSPDGGWHSPGFSQQYLAAPGETYKVSFWIKNAGCEFIVRIGGVSAMDGKYDTIVKTKENYYEWKQFEYNYTMPSEFKNIRIEVNVLQPGTFWIDNIKIEGVTELAF